MMSHKNKPFTVKPIAAAISATLLTPATVMAQEKSGATALEEVIVTARKREENLQDIPSSIQAISGDSLKEMGAQNMEDYARFIPSVDVQSLNGAGDNRIVFRGISTGATSFIAQSAASLYIDEASVTTTGSQPGVRMFDINRVEALAGPQGTLYGASAQAGTLRIYTNQPDPARFEASIDTTVKKGSDSDVSHDVIGVLNLPIVKDKFAVRIAINTAEDGGFIDNVLGNTPDSHFYGYSNTGVGRIDNSRIAEDNYNSTDYLTARVSALWHVNDQWTATLSYMNSESEQIGGNDYNPFVGDLETIKWTKPYNKDEWDLTALTIQGDLGWAQFVSSTSFFDRTYTYVQDATAYNRYLLTWGCVSPPNYAYYYNFTTSGGDRVAYAQYCQGATAEDDLTTTTSGPEEQDKFAQEIRLSAQGDTLDWMLGLYYEKGNDDWDNLWVRPGPDTVPFQDSLAMQYWRERYTTADINSSDPAEAWRAAQYAANPALLDNATSGSYYTDRTYWEQQAIFGEVTWHISDKLDLTLGGRYFERDNEKLYRQYDLGAGAADDGATPGYLRYDFGPDQFQGQVKKGHDSEFVPKIALSYALTDNKMVYGVYTQGFKAGGENRGRAEPGRSTFPVHYEPDELTNTEIGFKSRWADNTVELNVALFNMDWNDFQIEVPDPSGLRDCDANDPSDDYTIYCDQPWQKVVANVGSAHSTGLEVQTAWVPAAGWDLGANAQWIEAEVDEDLPDANIKKGTALPNTPEFKAGAWASYAWPAAFIEGEIKLRAQYSYQGSSKNEISDLPETSLTPTLNQASYGIADLRLSFLPGNAEWELEFFIDNLTDERAEIFQKTDKLTWGASHSTQYEHWHQLYTNRPRELGMRFAYRWGD